MPKSLDREGGYLAWRNQLGCSKCGHISCVCEILAQHTENCLFRKAATSGIGIECEHGLDCCPTCDPCTCGEQHAKT